jgi:hypothetical protein
MERIRKRRRRRNRRESGKRTRLVLLLVGTLSLVMGGVLALWALIEGDPRPRFFGMMYAIVGAACLAVYLVASGISLLGRAHDRHSGEPAEPRESGTPGFALLAALLLTAFLAGVVLHALTGAHLALRGARTGQVAALLRTATTDALWRALPGVGRAGTPAERELALPSDVTTRIGIRELERSALPAPLVRQAAPALGRYYTVDAVSSMAGERVTCAVRAYLCRVPAGDIRVLGWIERP